MKVPRYDPKCEKLARYFLDDEGEATEEDVSRLAMRLQETAEKYLQELRRG
jgi:hypothetical protein